LIDPSLILFTISGGRQFGIDDHSFAGQAPDRFLSIEGTLKSAFDPPAEIWDVGDAQQDLRTAAESGNPYEIITGSTGLNRSLQSIGPVPCEFADNVGLIKFMLDLLRLPD
jgi:hypothetical protein